MATGAGSVGRLGLVARRHAGEHDRAVDAGGRGAAEVGVEPVAHHQRAARAQAVERRLEQEDVGLADAAGGALGGVLQRGEDRAGRRPVAVVGGEGAIAPGGDHLGAVEHGLGGGAQLRESEVVVAGHHHDLRAGRRGRCR